MYVTAKVYAAILGVAPRTVRKNAPTLGGKKVGSLWRFEADDDSVAALQKGLLPCHSKDRVQKTGGLKSTEKRAQREQQTAQQQQNLKATITRNQRPASPELVYPPDLSISALGIPGKN